MTDERDPDIIRDKGCGFAYPSADGSHDREQLDRFADFLRCMAEGPVNTEGPAEAIGWVGITEETYSYMTGVDVAPVAVSADHPVTYWKKPA